MRIIIILFFFQLFHLAAQEQSLLWVISKEGQKKSYVFGTVHLIPDSLFYMPKKLKKVLSSADELVMEIGNINDLSVVKKMQEMMLLESGSCFDIFSETQKDSVLIWGSKLTGQSKKMFENSFEGFKPFALMQLNAQKMLQGDVKMYETELKTIAENYKLTISGLETIDFQLGLFSKINDSTMANMIMEQIRDPEDSNQLQNKMYQLYVSQDVEGLAKLTSISENGNPMPGVNELLFNRNLIWIPKISELTKNKSCFIAVGAGHLGGEKGILNLLKNDGYLVKPISF